MLKDIDPILFAAHFAIRIRETAKILAAVSGLIDSVRATQDPPNIETVALRVASYARGDEIIQPETEAAISMVARLAYNPIVDLESDPEFDRVLRGNEPQDDTSTIVIGAHARFLLDTNRPVRVALLAVLANVSYANCAMNVHRGKLKGSRGMVTVTSAKEFLNARKRQITERQQRVKSAPVPHKIRNEGIPRKRLA